MTRDMSLLPAATSLKKAFLEELEKMSLPFHGYYFDLFLSFASYYFFLRQSCSAVKAGLEFVILIRPPLPVIDSRREPPHLAVLDILYLELFPYVIHTRFYFQFLHLCGEIHLHIFFVCYACVVSEF